MPLSERILGTLGALEVYGLINASQLTLSGPASIARTALLGLLTTLPGYNLPLGESMSNPLPISSTVSYVEECGQSSESMSTSIKSLGLPSSTPSFPQISGPSVPVDRAVSVPTHIRAVVECRLLVAHGKTIDYQSSDLPPYVPVGISLEIEVLARLWDDSWTSWNKTSPLVIKSIPVALIHWPSVRWPSPVWAKAGKTWKRWEVGSSERLLMFSSLIKSEDTQILMIEYHRLGPTCFASKWQIGGVMMITSHIIAALEIDARNADIDLTAKARAEYGDTFAQHFTYLKGGRRHIYSTPYHIARHYRDLHRAHHS